MNLYELPAIYDPLQRGLDDPIPEDVPLDQAEVTEATLLTVLDAYGRTIDRQELVTNLVKLARSLDAEAAALELEANRLLTRATARRNRYSTIRTFVQMQLEAAGVAKMTELIVGTVWLQRNAPSVRVVAPESVPDSMKRGTVKMPLDQVYEKGLGDSLTGVEILTTPILDNFKETGEIPPGVEINAQRKADGSGIEGTTFHVRWSK